MLKVFGGRRFGTSWYILLIVVFSGCSSPSREQVRIPDEMALARFCGADSDNPADGTVLLRNLLNYQESLQPATVSGSEEVYWWHFYPEGTFQTGFLSDYTTEEAGAWSLLTISDSSGVLFLASKSREGPVPSSKRVFSVQLKSDTAFVGEKIFQFTKPAFSDSLVTVAADLIAEVNCDNIKDSFGLWGALSAVSWEQTDSNTLSPHRFQFGRDGRFVAFYQNPSCMYEGSWSLESNDEIGGTLSLSVPTHPCDPRGPSDAHLRSIPISLVDSTSLLLSGTRYGSSP